MTSEQMTAIATTIFGIVSGVSVMVLNWLAWRKRNEKDKAEEKATERERDAHFEDILNNRLSEYMERTDKEIARLGERIKQLEQERNDCLEKLSALG